MPISVSGVRRLGVRDELVAHAKRDEQLADQGLDIAGIKRLFSNAWTQPRNTSVSAKSIRPLPQ